MFLYKLHIKLLYITQKFYVMTMVKLLKIILLYDIISRLDVRRSERLPLK